MSDSAGLNRSFLRLRAAAGLVLLACGTLPARAFIEDPITVDSIDGTGVGDGCTFAEAIGNANANFQLHPDCQAGGISSPNDIIDFDPALLAGGPVELPGADLPNITDILEIRGPGARLLTILGGDSGIFRLEASANNSLIRDLTLKGGTNVAADGGGIVSNGARLTLGGLRVVGNRARSGGGVYVANADLQIFSSEISRNVALPGLPDEDGVGGGVYYLSSLPNPTPRTVTLANVTLSGNSAEDFGGGVAVKTLDGAANVEVRLLHVTLANNLAGAAGGALHLEPHAGSGGIISAALEHTACGDNSAATGPDLFESSDTTLGLTYSVVETSSGYSADTSVGSLNADPGFAPLGCNGGPTLTHLLAPSSPAIDIVPTGVSCTVATDQRGSGFPRKLDGDGDTAAECDAGAFESRPAEDGALGSFHTVTPCRMVDTRSPAGPHGGPPISGQQTRTFSLFGICSIPDTAVAVAVNATAIDGSTADSLLIFEGDHLSPPHGGGPAAVIPYPIGRTRANNAVVSICPTGTVKVRTFQTIGTVDFVLDVVGYFD